MPLPSPLDRLWRRDPGAASRCIPVTVSIALVVLLLTLALALDLGLARV